MKKILLIITLAIFAFNSQAQGRLQFNQVLTIDTAITTSNSNYIHSNEYIVPTNKVWKVCRLFYNESGIARAQFLLNNIKIATEITSSYSNSEVFWMKESDTIKFGLKSDSNGVTGGFLVSIIEFNIIPE